MTYNDSRKEYRRQFQRRFTERRVSAHLFIGLQWLDSIKHSTSIWPTENRRIEDRRDSDRRDIVSRRQKNTYRVSPKIASSLENTLSEGETQLLIDINHQHHFK